MPPSKQVLDREKSTRAVVAAADTHAADIAAAITRELSTHLHKGETLPDLGLLGHLIGRKLKADFDVLVRADRAHEAELSDDAAPRDARDVAAEKVRSALVDLRDSVNTAYGAAGLKKLGLAEAISADPTAIASRAVSVEEALHDDTIKLPKSRRPSLKVDLKGFAAELAADLPALVKALDHVAREEREAKVTQAAKNEAMAGHDRGFSRGAGLLAGLASYGGVDEVAATIRPSTSKAGRTVAEEEPAPAAGGESSGG
jgi:hypothetical protein